MRRDLVIIGEMIAAAESAIAIVDGLDATDLDNNGLRRDAALWNMTILGEASNQVSEPLKSKYPDIPWRLASGFRNRLVHGYWEVDLDIVVSTIRNDLPVLLVSLRAIDVTPTDQE